MLKRVIIPLALLLAAATAPVRGAETTTQLTRTDAIVWDDALCLPAPNDSTAHRGLAGVFAGKAGGRLVVAGGANFPGAMPWEGGEKRWYGDVYLYDETDGWKTFPGALPHPAAYGVSVTLPQGVLCIGGCDASRCMDEVFLLTVENGAPRITEWPPLPAPLANAAGCLAGGKVYVAGGSESMTPAKATKRFFTLDPAAPAAGWRELPAWPGRRAATPSPRGRATEWITVSTSSAAATTTATHRGPSTATPTATTRGSGHGRPSKATSPSWRARPRRSAPTTSSSSAASRTTKPSRTTPWRLYHTVTGTMTETDVEKSSFILPVTTAVVSDGRDITIASGETAPGIRTPVILRGHVDDDLHRMGWLDILVIVLYFLSLAWIGWYFSKKQKSTGDYFKGGGRIPWFIVGLSIFGTSLSAITFMAIPAKAFATDWSYLLFNAGIILVVPLITAVFIPFFRRLNVTTAYEYLELRFNALIRVVCSVSFIIFQIGRMAVVLLLPSIALNIVTGIDIFLCIGMMGVLSLAYTLMGGIEAVVWTEAVQVVVLLGAAVAVVCSIAFQLPEGFRTIFTAAGDAGKFSLGESFFDLRQPTIWTVLIATVFTNITTYGTDQTIVQRYLTTDSEKAARKGVYTNAALTVPASLLFFLLGTALWAFYKFHPQELSMSIADSDAILPWYMSTALPRGVLGLVIAGLFAAAMSTLSSSMNSAATAFVTDIYRKVRPDRDERAHALAPAGRPSCWAWWASCSPW